MVQLNLDSPMPAFLSSVRLLWESLGISLSRRRQRSPPKNASPRLNWTPPKGRSVLRRLALLVDQPPKGARILIVRVDLQSFAVPRLRTVTVVSKQCYAPQQHLRLGQIGLPKQSGFQRIRGALCITAPLIYSAC